MYIYKCEGSTIQIKGKVNGITLDGCKKTAVVFDNCVASFEMVNCQSCQVQVTGAVPTVAIEKTDGAQVRVHRRRGGRGLQHGDWRGIAGWAVLSPFHQARTALHPLSLLRPPVPVANRCT